jgi:hypothetical protein
MGVPVEEMECLGCRSQKRIAYCDNCKFVPCATEKGIDFCGECDEYPCSDLKEFQKQMPHRVELWEYHEKIKKQGWEKWFENMTEHYSCPECETINSAYDLKCRKCGHFPGSEFAEKHNEMISEHLKSLFQKK